MTNSEEKAHPEITTDEAMDRNQNSYGNTYSYGGLTKREYFPVPHHCDSFKHVGNTWDLYVSGKLVESITTVQTVTVEADPND